MKAVVDTNVIAYFLLWTRPFLDEAREFWQTTESTLAPSIWEAEYANVVWMAVRSTLIEQEKGRERLRLATLLGVQSIPIQELWQGALTRAAISGVPVYDTLFVELAVRESLPLATFDAQLHRAFPDVAVPPRVLSA